VSFFMVLRIALRALNRNKVRSALTMLGVIIGVASVIAMVAIGSGATQAVQKQIATMGQSQLTIFPGASSSGAVSFGGGSAQTLTPDDAAAIADMPRSFCVSCSRPDIAAINFGNRSGRGRRGGAAAEASGPRGAPPSRKRICFSTQAALSSPASTAMRRAASKVLASKVRTPIDGSAGAIVTSAAPSSATSMLPESSGPRQNRNNRSASCRVSGIFREPISDCVAHDRISKGLFQTGFRRNQSR